MFRRLVGWLRTSPLPVPQLDWPVARWQRGRGARPPSDPQLTVHTLDGSYVRLRTTPADQVISVLESLADVDPDLERVGLFSFDLDGGRSQVHVPRAAIARVDVDWELGRWRRCTGWLLVRLDRWL